MLSGVIWKQILVFFVPILIGSIFQQIYNMVDSIVVGQYVGTNALAAVGTTGSIINLLIGFFVGISSGATVIIAQYFGAGDGEKVHRAVQTGIAFSIVSGLILTVVGIATARPLLRLTRVPDEILDDSVLYMNTIYAGITGSMVYNIGTGILRAIGDSRRPLYILIVCCVVNIILDVTFVVAFHWGVMGVGVATSISQLISAICVVVILARTKESYHLDLRHIRFYTEQFREMIRIGLPSGLESVLYSITNVLLQAAINEFDTTAIAAWSTSSRVDAIMWMVLQAYSISISTFVGQNFGARQYDRTKKGIHTGLLMDFVSITLISILLFSFAPQLVSIFTSDQEVIELGGHFIRVFTPSYPIFVFVSALSAAVRGCGESMQPTLLTGLGICGLRLLWIFLVVPLHHTVTMVALSYDVSWVITAVMFIIYYKRGNWLKRCIARSVGSAPETQQPTL